MEYFDTSAWRQAAQHGDWYLRIQKEYQQLLQRAKANPDEAEAIKEAVRSFFEELLVASQLVLGEPDARLDAQRQPIRQAVIHHSNREPGYYSLDRLNAVHLLNLYVPNYSNPTSADRQHIKGEPITSNHYRNGRMVFYGYHWWVETDGTTTRLLPDEAIGWHAGNWDVNCQSIGICINDNLTNKEPSDAALAAVRQILQGYESHQGQLEVLGHRQANPKTQCPGDLFLTGWKKKIVSN